jgi:ligand-binding sensor domain-containing protein/DNA-binding CsgD family transcriptional regulator
VKYSILIISLLLFSLPSLKAQAEPFGSPSITNFSRSDYQAGTQNWAILQDKRGIVYFANNKGLLEFDGTNWQTFPLPNATIARSLSFDTDGRLYIGAQSEMGYLEPNEEGKNIFKSLAHLIPEELQGFEDIWKIFIEEESILFCSEKAVFRLKGEDIAVISPGESRFDNFFQLADKIFILDKEKGLFSLVGDQLIPYPDGVLFKDQRIIAILPHEENQSLIVTVTKGLFLMDESGIRPWQTEASSFLSAYQPYCGIQLTDGRYAIGTSQNGLIIIDREGIPVMHLNHENGLQNNTILSIYQDIQQNLWLGLDNGIDYAIINSPFSTIRSVEGIEGTGYTSIIHQNNLYLGTNQGLFYTPWTAKSKGLAAEKFKPVENTIGQIWSLNKLGNEVIVGQHKGAFYLKENEAIPFSATQGAWKFMALNAHPGYAIGGTYSGILLYKNQNADLTGDNTPDWKMIRKLDGFNESARVFEEDEEGNIWISHAYKGLFKVELSDDLMSIKKTSTYNSSNGLPVDLFINVSKIRKELIFTTPKGIFKYKKEEDRFVEHEEFTEFFGTNKEVHYLKEDELGNIWFAVNDDFGVLNVQEKGVFNKVERLFFNQIQEDLVDGFEHIYTYDKSNVFIGTEKGFIHYDPSKNKNTAFPFKILIRKVTSITEGDSIMYWGNQFRDSSSAPLVFNYKMNDFRFAFSAPYYEKINHLHYRFKLEGFEDSWSKWTSKTEKEYTNLTAGDYQFKVQARNAYGQMSTEEAFAFTIFPPWYLSLYAKIAYFILAIISLTGLVKYVSKKEKKKTEVFKIAQAEKMARREAEFKREAEKSEGEIITLRNEKLQTDVDHKNSQLASATMHLVQKSEILVKVKNELNNLLANASIENKKKIQQIGRTIEADIRLDDNWDQFESHFDQVHENFFKRLRKEYPDLTPKDQKLCAYLRMNLTTKEVAPLMNISIRGVEISRYRLRKKLNMDPDTNLVSFILNI